MSWDRGMGDGAERGSATDPDLCPARDERLIRQRELRRQGQLTAAEPDAGALVLWAGAGLIARVMASGHVRADRYQNCRTTE